MSVHQPLPVPSQVEISEGASEDLWPFQLGPALLGLIGAHLEGQRAAAPLLLEFYLVKGPLVANFYELFPPLCKKTYRRGTDVLAILLKSDPSFYVIGRFCNNKK